MSAEVSGEAALRDQMANLGIGTAHNTLANEEEDDPDETTGASSNTEDQNRQVQISQLTAMLQGQQMKVRSGATPMNTQGAEERRR